MLNCQIKITKILIRIRAKRCMSNYVISDTNVDQRHV